MPVGSSYTLKPKEIPLEYLTGEAIEGEGTLAEGPKDPFLRKFKKISH